MKKAIFIIILTIVAGILLVSYFMSNNAEPIVFKEDKNSFLIPSANMEYVIPTDISRWAVAPSKSLPEGMLFFGVDTENSVCVGIFKPEKPLKSPHKTFDYSHIEFIGILQTVCKSDSSLNILSEEYHTNDTIFSSASAKEFRVHKEVSSPDSPNDTISMYYNGFVFDKGDSPYGIVVISGEEPNDSSNADNNYIYINSLKFN